MDSPLIVSPPFRLTKRRFSQVATIFFLRRYWMVYAMAILIGITILVVQRDGLGLWLGLVLTIYPFTVPIRYSMVVSAKASSFLDREMTYELLPDSFLIRNDLGGATQAQLSGIRNFEVIKDTLVLLFGKAAFLMIPLEVLSIDDRKKVLEKVRTRGI